jgi:hypothetical protein
MIWGGALLAYVPSIALNYGVVANIEDYPMTPLPSGPVRFVLRRITLPANAMMPAYDPLERELILVDGGQVSWQSRNPAATGTPTLPPVTTLTSDPGIVARNLKPDAVLTIWSDEDQLVTLYTLSLDPIESPAATPPST